LAELAIEYRAISALDCICPQRAHALGRADSANRREHPRVLYTTDALHPDRARLVALPNLRKAQGLAFCAEAGAGVCFQFPMPVD
jgi:hypothetical protein